MMEGMGGCVGEDQIEDVKCGIYRISSVDPLAGHMCYSDSLFSEQFSILWFDQVQWLQSWHFCTERKERNIFCTLRETPRTDIKSLSFSGKTLQEFLDIINESNPQSRATMSRSTRQREPGCVTSSHSPLHDINRGIKTKIHIYTIGIILASRGSRMSVPVPGQVPGVSLR